MGVFSDRLRALREEKGKTQQDVAKELGITAQALSGYERGREPAYDMLKALASYYRVTCDYLTGNSFDRIPTSKSPAEFSALFRSDGFMLLPDDEKQKLFKHTRTILRELERYFSAGEIDEYVISVVVDIMHKTLFPLRANIVINDDEYLSIFRYYNRIENAIASCLTSVTEKRIECMRDLQQKRESLLGNEEQDQAL